MFPLCVENDFHVIKRVKNYKQDALNRPKGYVVAVKLLRRTAEAYKGIYKQVDAVIWKLGM